jgi:hypothetical protein
MLTDSMDNSLRDHLGFEDYILFQPIESTVAGRPLLIVDNFAVGKIIGGTANVLQVPSVYPDDLRGLSAVFTTTCYYCCTPHSFFG